MSAAWWLLAAVAQDPVFIETRFERVHLRNGSFIDGRIVKEDAGGVTLAMKPGEMRIRRDQVARIEKVRMRSLAAKPERKELRVAATPAEAGFADVLGPSAPKIPAASRPAPDPILAQIESAPDAELPDLTNSLLERGPEELATLADGFGRLNPRARRVVAGVLRKARPAASIPALKRHAAGADPAVRAESVAILGSFHDPSLAPDLRGFLRDPEPPVRGAAIPGLVAVGDRDCFEILAALCQDPDPAVRSRAIAGSIDLAARHNLRRDLFWALRDALDRSEGAAKIELLSAVGRAGLRELEEVVLPLLDDLNPRVRAQAATTLAALSPRRAAEFLLSRLATEREYWPRVQLAEAARALRLRAAIPELLRWLDDEEMNIRMAATRSLRELTGQSFGLDRDRWHAWWRSAASRP